MPHSKPFHATSFTSSLKRLSSGHLAVPYDLSAVADDACVARAHHFASRDVGARDEGDAAEILKYPDNLRLPRVVFFNLRRGGEGPSIALLHVVDEPGR